MEDDLAVVVLSYNRAELIDRTLASIKAQTLAGFSCVIIDDASSDGAEEVAQREIAGDPRFALYQNPQNLGMPTTLNRALRSLKKKYVAVVHDGDWCDPELFAEWRRTLDACGDAALVFNSYVFVRRDGTIVWTSKEEWPVCMPPGYLLRQAFLRRRNFDSPVWGCALVRLDVVSALGFLDPQYGPVADVDLWLKIAQTHHVGYAGSGKLYILDRNSVPSNWESEKPINDKLVRKAFWCARLRSTQGTMGRRAKEICKHGWYVLRRNTRRGAARITRRIRSVVIASLRR